MTFLGLYLVFLSAAERYSGCLENLVLISGFGLFLSQMISPQQRERESDDEDESEEGQEENEPAEGKPR